MDTADYVMVTWAAICCLVKGRGCCNDYAWYFTSVYEAPKTKGDRAKVRRSDDEMKNSLWARGSEYAFRLAWQSWFKSPQVNDDGNQWEAVTSS